MWWLLAACDRSTWKFETTTDPMTDGQVRAASRTIDDAVFTVGCRDGEAPFLQLRAPWMMPDLSELPTVMVRVGTGEPERWDAKYAVGLVRVDLDHPTVERFSRSDRFTMKFGKVDGLSHTATLPLDEDWTAALRHAVQGGCVW